jgi:hypothetical protein
MLNENHLSVWRALFGWIDQPKKTLRSVVRQPRWPLWLAPALTIVLALVIATVVSAPSASELAQEQAEQQVASQMGQLPEEQAAQVEQSLETFTSPLFIGATGIALGTLGSILTWLFRGAVLFFIAYLLGTDTRYVQMVTLALWCWLPFALRDLVQAVYVLINGQMPVNRGLSFLVASSDQVQNAGNLAYGFLSQVDPFLAWHLFLVAIGLTVTTRSTTLKTTLGTIGYWAVTALVGLAPSLLGALTSSAF